MYLDNFLYFIRGLTSPTMHKFSVLFCCIMALQNFYLICSSTLLPFLFLFCFYTILGDYFASRTTFLYMIRFTFCAESANTFPNPQECNPLYLCFSVTRFGLGLVPAISALVGVVVTCTMKLHPSALNPLADPLLAVS